jgi:hypothetical protein
MSPYTPSQDITKLPGEKSEIERKSQKITNLRIVQKIKRGHQYREYLMFPGFVLSQIKAAGAELYSETPRSAQKWHQIVPKQVEGPFEQAHASL